MREFRFPDESTRWVRIRYVPKRDQNGNNNGFYVVVFDIHDLKTQQRILQQKQEELRRTSWLLSSHLDNSPLAALELDAELFIRRWSDQAEKLFGWQRTHVMGRSIWQLNLIGPDEPDTLSRSLAMVMAVKPQKISSLIQVTRQDGSKLWCEWYLSALLDERGELLSIFALVHDVHQRIQAEATLQQLAAFDALTSLPNRSSLQFELTQALDRAQRNHTGVAALFIDLDHFKNVNDQFGHHVGDEVLTSLVTHSLELSPRMSQLKIERIGKIGSLESRLATPLSLVVTELIHNALEHGLATSGTHLRIELQRYSNEGLVTISDDGVGLPDGFNLATSANLGLQIVLTLTENELNGDLKLESSEKGTQAKLRFPL
jgi:PAS domain S-box-containing protein